MQLDHSIFSWRPPAQVGHLSSEQGYDLLAACFGAIRDRTYGHEEKRDAAPAPELTEAVSGSETGGAQVVEKTESPDSTFYISQPNLTPLDTSSEQALKDSFRKSAFQMAEAQGGPTAEELEKHRQESLRDYERDQKSKEFWKKLGF
ncbi:MAG: hypothetical protein HYU64_06375 [Armatimonadetes bacterium]|nr:hypothetical protein [Armatimonadota bacterium]